MRRTFCVAVLAGVMVAALVAVSGSVPAGAAPVGPGQQLTHGPGERPGPGGPHGNLRPAAGGAPSGHTVVPSAWTTVASPNVTDGTTTEDYLYDVSCVSATFCVAVGEVDSSGTGQTLVEQWNGATWSVVTSPNVSASDAEGVYGVDCLTTTFCVAVGTVDESSGTRGLIEQWNGATWSFTTTAAPVAADNYNLYGVSCLSDTSCVAAGEWYVTSPTYVDQTYAVRWDGGSWTVTTTPDPSATESWFNNVTCHAGVGCLALGGSETGSNAGLTMVAQWNGTSWVQLTTPTPSAGGELTDASCPSASFCVAVGFSHAAVSTTLVEQWNGHTWSSVPTPNVSGSFGDQLWGVSCTGTTSCVTVGSEFTSSLDPDPTSATYVTEALTYNGASWSLLPPQNPAPSAPGADQAELYGVSCVAGHSCVAAGDDWPDTVTDDTLVEQASIPRPGYRFVAGDGGIFAFGQSSFHGSMGGSPLNRPVVGMAATPDGGGYWLVAGDGGIFSFGDAGFYGSTGALPLNQPIVGMAATPDGGGYWLVARDGGIFAFGDAGFYGSTGSLTLNRPIVGMAPTPSGQGYWLVASDGGIFAFGDAGFYGSTGALPLNSPVVGMAPTPSGHGYWLVASDGGLFAFGDAGFFGSAGGGHLNQPVVGMAATPDGQGYWLVAGDGGIFAYGDAPFDGSAGNLPLNSPIVGMTA